MRAVSAPYHNKALAEGSILREWKLEAVLGVGGFGIVYRGKDIHFGESVAIKEYFPGAISDRIDGTTVAPTDSSSEEIYQLGRQKFMEEAKILWNLSRPQRHPNLVSVRSLFEIHGTAYMVMDFESGVSLSQIMRDGKTFDEKSLLAIIKPIAEGLDRAHQAGVLHRDIKPANILINMDGRPVLIDFGSARFESGNATNTKVTFYTPPYAALEQYVKSFPQGPWTDIYALGVVLYQCVTGEKPPEVLERMHGDHDVALSAREWPGYSKTFTRAVDAAMKVRPVERPNSISAWLKMFDGEEIAVPVDEATRVAAPLASLPASFQPAVQAKTEAPKPAAPVKAETPKPAAAPAAAAKPAAEAKAAAELKVTIEHDRKLPVPVLAGAAAGLVILGVAGWFFLGRGPATPAPGTAAIPATAAAPAAPGAGAPVQAANSGADMGAKLDALIDAAKKAARPNAEIAGFTAAKTKLADLAAKGDTAGLGSETASMAKAENGILARTEKKLWQEVDPATDPLNAVPQNDAVRQLQTGKSDLDTALKLTSTDPAQTIDNMRQAITAFGAFQQDFALAMPAYVDARRKAFADLHTATKAVVDQVASLAAVEKPWFLAAKARQDAYQLRQDNATKAKTTGAELDGLAQKVATSTDLAELSGLVAQAKTINQNVSALYAASNAAKP